MLIYNFYTKLAKNPDCAKRLTYIKYYLTDDGCRNGVFENGARIIPCECDDVKSRDK